MADTVAAVTSVLILAVRLARHPFDSEFRLVRMETYQPLLPPLLPLLLLLSPAAAAAPSLTNQ